MASKKICGFSRTDTECNYSKKYYSYVLVVEDEQQPELVGKIMILQYGKTIKDKIKRINNKEGFTILLNKSLKVVFRNHCVHFS